jgi:CHAT domain-containing protein
MLVEAALRSGSREESVAYSERGKGRTIHDLMITKGIEADRFKPEPLRFPEIQDLARRLEKVLVMFRVTERGTFAFTVDAEGALDLTGAPEFTSKRLQELVVEKEDKTLAGGWHGSYSRYRTSQDEAGRLMAKQKRAEASSLMREASERWLGTMESTLRTLSDELMLRVFDKLPKGSKVALVPNGALNVLPLHACSRTVDGRKRYLLEEYEISYVPNCNILDLCLKREAERRDRGRLLAVANPAPPYDLVFSEWEVEEIAKHFDQRDVYVKAEVKGALLERMAESGVLHLATHGVHDLGSSFDSRLRMGEGTDLTLGEVFERVRLARCWLVCLSACESGLVDYRDVADEFIGLQAGFLYAGAPTVVASLWSIADYTTALLMMKLYSGIYEKGMGKVAALRGAQLWLKELTAREALDQVKSKEDVLEYGERIGREDLSRMRRRISLEDADAKPFAHPYFWAGFQAFGV